MFVSVEFKQLFRMNKQIAERVAKHQEQGICLRCDGPINGSTPSRGCCSGCYQATRRAIRRGLLVDSELVKEGKLLPRDEAGRKPTNPVTKELRDAS